MVTYKIAKFISLGITVRNIQPSLQENMINP